MYAFFKSSRRRTSPVKLLRHRHPVLVCQTTYLVPPPRETLICKTVAFPNNAHLCSSQSMIFGLSGPPDNWWLATPLISPSAYLKGATERAKKHRSRKIKRKSFPRHLACGPIKCECKFFRPPIQRNHQKILSISSKTICMNLKGLSVQLQVITFLAIGS